MASSRDAIGGGPKVYIDPGDVTYRMRFRRTAALTVVLVVALSGCAGLLPGGFPSNGSEGGSGGPSESGFTYPPGYNETGVTDGARAVRAHNQSILSYESFTIAYRATVESSNESTRINITRKVNTSARRVLLYSTVGPRKTTEFHTNRTVYIRKSSSESGPSYFSREALLDLWRYAGTDFVRPVITNVNYNEATRVTRNGIPVARFEDRRLSNASGLFGLQFSRANVSNFSATLVVGSDGVVRHATYEATLDKSSKSKHLTVVIDVSAINSTTVSRPEWVEKAE